MRKTILFLICMLIFPVLVLAEGGLLPDLNELYDVSMPSFSEVLNRYPDSVTLDENGASIETYNRVTEDQFSEFGVLLNEKDCVLSDYVSDKGVLTAEIQRNGKSFLLMYDSINETAVLTYPQGTVDEYMDAAETLYVQAKDEMSDNLFSEARNTLGKIVDYENYKDASDLITECFYGEAKLLMDYGNYDEAIEQFTALEKYKDSSQMIRKCKYLKGKKLYEESQYAEAAEVLTDVKGYEDANDMLAVAEVEIRKKALVTVGETITFGRYDNEDLVWAIAAVDGNKSLLVLTEAFKDKPLDEKDRRTTWSGCSLRKWLNGDFIKQSFTKDEQKAILTSKISMGKGTSQDKVFIPSSEEGKYSSYCKKYDYHIRDVHNGEALYMTHYGSVMHIQHTSNKKDVVPMMWVDNQAQVFQ